MAGQSDKPQKKAPAGENPRSKRWDWAMMWGLVSVMAWVLFFRNGQGYIAAIAVVLLVFALSALLRAVRRTPGEANVQAMAVLTREINPPNRVCNRLMEHERVLWMTTIHPLRMARWWAVFVVTAPLALSALWLRDEVPDMWYLSIVPLGIWVFGVACMVAIWRVERLCLTNERILSVRGILSTEETTMPIGRITDTSLYIPWHSRFLSWLRLIGAPYGTFASEQKKITFVPYAQTLNHLVMQLVLRDSGPRGR